MPFTDYFCDGFDCSASVVVATLYNQFGDAQATTPAVVDASTCVIELDPILMDMKEFRELFYPSASGAFSLNEGLRGSGVTSFTEQTLSDSDGVHEFNLMDYILSCYESELNIQRKNISPLHLIQLQKDLSRYNNMFDIRGSTYALKWNEVIEVLEQLGSLKHPEEAIMFKIVFNYVNTSFIKTTPVQVVFNYKVIDMFPNYWQFRAGIPKQKIHPSNPLRVIPQFIRKADGTIITSGAGFPSSVGNYSIWTQDNWGQRIMDNNTQEPQLAERFKRDRRAEALDEMLGAMLEDNNLPQNYC